MVTQRAPAGADDDGDDAPGENPLSLIDDDDLDEKEIMSKTLLSLIMIEYHLSCLVILLGLCYLSS